jgi:hypothetical protein
MQAKAHLRLRVREVTIRMFGVLEPVPNRKHACKNKTYLCLNGRIVATPVCVCVCAQARECVHSCT